MTATWAAIGSETPTGGELAVLERQLTAEFSDDVPPEAVRCLIADIASGFDDAQIRMYVPLLVERIARDWLRDAVRESQPLAHHSASNAGERALLRHSSARRGQGWTQGGQQWTQDNG